MNKKFVALMAVLGSIALILVVVIVVLFVKNRMPQETLPVPDVDVSTEMIEEPVIIPEDINIVNSFSYGEDVEINVEQAGDVDE